MEGKAFDFKKEKGKKMKSKLNVDVVVDDKKIDALVEKILEQLVYDKVRYNFDDTLKVYLRQVLFSKEFIEELKNVVRPTIDELVDERLKEVITTELDDKIKQYIRDIMLARKYLEKVFKDKG
jgi:hypothetical protein